MELIRLSSIDSTNEEAKRLFHQGTEPPFAVVAEQQLAGKGTQGRQWLSPKGTGLYLSIVHGHTTLQASPLYTLAAGIACAEVLSEHFPITIHLKPINDLYSQGKKLGGILTESLWQAGRMSALITGIGINVLQDERPLVTEAKTEAISLEEALPNDLSVKQALSVEQVLHDPFIKRLSETLSTWYDRLESGEIDTLLDTWQYYQVPGTLLPKDIAESIKAHLQQHIQREHRQCTT